MEQKDLIDLISSKIKLIRIEKGYTQESMAKVLGISKKSLVQIEKGRQPLGWTLAIAVCTLFRESEILQTVLGNDPLEIVNIIAFDKYERPKEKTLGGKVWWRAIDKNDKFRLQQNIISGHYRILDRENRRWCSSFNETYIRQRFEELTNS